jgi:hypothetical protein
MPSRLSEEAAEPKEKRVPLRATFCLSGMSLLSS